MSYHRLDLPSMHIDAWDNIRELSNENFVIVNLRDNELTNFDHFGTHPYLLELDVRNNKLDSFLGLTRQAALRVLHLSGNVIAQHPYYRIMALLVVGYSLHCIDGVDVTEQELLLAKSIPSQAAIAVSYGWLLDLQPRLPQSFQKIISDCQRLRAVHRRRSIKKFSLQNALAKLHEQNNTFSNNINSTSRNNVSYKEDTNFKINKYTADCNNTNNSCNESKINEKIDSGKSNKKVNNKYIVSIDALSQQIQDLEQEFQILLKRSQCAGKNNKLHDLSALDALHDEEEIDEKKLSCLSLSELQTVSCFQFDNIRANQELEENLSNSTSAWSRCKLQLTRTSIKIAFESRNTISNVSLALSTTVVKAEKLDNVLRLIENGNIIVCLLFDSATEMTAVLKCIYSLKCQLRTITALTHNNVNELPEIQLEEEQKINYKSKSNNKDNRITEHDTLSNDKNISEGEIHNVLIDSNNNNNNNNNHDNNNIVEEIEFDLEEPSWNATLDASTPLKNYIKSEDRSSINIIDISELENKDGMEDVAECSVKEHKNKKANDEVRRDIFAIEDAVEDVAPIELNNKNANTIFNCDESIRCTTSAYNNRDNDDINDEDNKLITTNSSMRSEHCNTMSVAPDKAFSKRETLFDKARKHMQYDNENVNSFNKYRNKISLSFNASSSSDSSASGKQHNCYNSEELTRENNDINMPQRSLQVIKPLTALSSHTVQKVDKRSDLETILSSPVATISPATIPSSEPHLTLLHNSLKATKRKSSVSSITGIKNSEHNRKKSIFTNVVDNNNNKFNNEQFEKNIIRSTHNSRNASHDNLNKKNTETLEEETLSTQLANTQRPLINRNTSNTININNSSNNNIKVKSKIPPSPSLAIATNAIKVTTPIAVTTTMATKISDKNSVVVSKHQKLKHQEFENILISSDSD